MWVFLNHAMVSIVAHRTKRGHLLVRARLKGDLEKLFPRAKVTRTPDADYLYRCTVTRAAVAKVLASECERIDYDNFKGSVPFDEKGRSAAYGGVWSVMMRAQLAAEPRTGGQLGVDFEPVDWRGPVDDSLPGGAW